MVDLLEKVDLSKIKLPPVKKTKCKKYGVMQFTDIHACELVLPEETNWQNAYDFEIMSKRIRKFVLKSIDEFKHEGITDVYIALTGDLVNSSRRVSEKLAQISSLCKAALLLTSILEQAFIELRKAGFTLHVTSIVGNESRLLKDMESGEMSASENWDFLIFNNLRHLFKQVKGVNFIIPDNNIMSILEFPNGFNMLMLHGHTVRGQADKAIWKLIQNYVFQGTPINMVIMGHLHNASIGDFICRASSLCGANSYSSNDLMFLSRASQNVYVINEDKSFKGVKIDVQETDGIIGYDIIEELESYVATRQKPTMRILSEVIA